MYINLVHACPKVATQSHQSKMNTERSLSHTQPQPSGTYSLPREAKAASSLSTFTALQMYSIILMHILTNNLHNTKFSVLNHSFTISFIEYHLPQITLISGTSMFSYHPPILLLIFCVCIYRVPCKVVFRLKASYPG